MHRHSERIGKYVQVPSPYWSALLCFFLQLDTLLRSQSGKHDLFVNTMTDGGQHAGHKAVEKFASHIAARLIQKMAPEAL